MKYDLVEMKEKLNELNELLNSRKGKTVSEKMLIECYSKIQWLDMMLLRVDGDLITEMVKRVRRDGKSTWHFEPLEGETIKIHAKRTLTVYPSAVNVVNVRSLTHEEESKLWEPKS